MYLLCHHNIFSPEFIYRRGSTFCEEKQQQRRGKNSVNVIFVIKLMLGLNNYIFIHLNSSAHLENEKNQAKHLFLL